MGKYQGYEKYKESGVEWLGAIPESWEVKRFKFLLSEPLKYGANEAAEIDDPNLPRYIRITDVKDDGTLKEDTFRSLPEDIAEDYLLDEGDILLARSGATVGKTFIYRKSWGKAAYAGYLIRARISHENNSDFIYQFLQSRSYWDWVNSIFIQATIQNISAEKYANFCISIPPLDEQDSIAHFLDRKTSQIDTLIAKKSALLEKLDEKRTALISHAVTKGLDSSVPMKDSGVEWLGDIPEHWNVKRLRYTGTCQNGVSNGADYFGSGYPFVNYTDVYANPELPKVVNGLAKSTDSDRVHYSVKTGDIFFTRTSETIEEIGIASTCFDSIDNAIFSGFLIRFRPLENLLFQGFSKYYFRSQLHRLFFVKEMNLVTRASLSQELLKRLPVLVTSLEEQQKIAEYLDKKTAEIDRQKAKVKEAIELLKEYRTALITNAVTGKIDVRQVANV
jgi:type I restriction enzyme, S subunit